MAVKSVYFVPEIQDKWFGKVEEVADIFWNKGIFLCTPNQHIYSRLKEFNAKGLAIPDWNHDFGFLEMGITDEGRDIPIKSDSGAVWARVYLWVTDIDDESWEPEFKTTVESILGPCNEFHLWES